MRRTQLLSTLLLLVSFATLAAAEDVSPTRGADRRRLPLGTGEALGKAGLGNEPPRPLTDRGVANLTSFAKLVGLVRYFHPSDQAARLDWSAWTIEAVGRVEKARDDAELRRLLARLLRPLAPTARIFRTGDPEPAGLPVTTAGARPIAWWHFGLATGTSGSSRHFLSRRLGGFAEEPWPDKPPALRLARETIPALPEPVPPLVADLGNGVSIQLPLVLFADRRGTLPPRPAARFETRKPEGFAPAGDDRATRIADIVLLWTALDLFYPYDLPPTWPASLGATLRAAAMDRDARAFLDTLRRLMAELDDNHATVSHASDRHHFRLPLTWRLFDGELLVTWVDPTVQGVAVGDVVEAIDGIPVAEQIARIEPLVSAATPAWRRYRMLELAAAAEKDGRRTLALRRLGQRFEVTLEAKASLSGADRIRGRRPEAIAELRPGIFYLDLDRIGDADFLAVLPRLAEARGLLFDLRGYPERISGVLLSHLLAAPAATPPFLTPVRTRPDVAPRLFGEPGRLQALEPHLSARAAFLTDERAYSRAETFLDVVSFYRLGEIVGGATGGTNGEVSEMELPGGYTATWTGSRARRLDGSSFQGAGIAPTVPVTPSREGIREGRDEVLERALALWESGDGAK